VRAILALCTFFILIALFWAVHGPVVAYFAVHSFADLNTDHNAAEEALRRAGPGAIASLRKGIVSELPLVRLRCARLLALQGYKEGDECLLEMLRKHGRDQNDPVGAIAETFLISVWSQREAPEEPLRLRLFNIQEAVVSDDKKLKAWGEALDKNRNWATGFVRRAMLNQNSGRAVEARDDALQALLLEPCHFEAITILAHFYMIAGAPEQACSCYERALRINPRIKHQKLNEIKEALEALKRDRKERRKERRRDALERPLV
jgi:tetratricopeptide (TPR) repeat protein